MFASFSSYIPSALQQVSLGGARPPDVPSPPHPTPPDGTDVDPPPKREKKEKKEKYPNEAFIIVRPPPSVSNQSLSLQVQLVPPQSRNDKPLQALDASPDDLSTDLRRTHSNGSESSNLSGYTGSSVSISSTSSSSASSSRRMIIPLYNLNVHSVMPTTILDAGTDAKVAKFAKRGLEIIGLAFLEPIEVRPTALGNAPLVASINARTSLDDSFQEVPSTSSLSTHYPGLKSRPHTSHAAVNPPADFPLKPTINVTPAPPLPSSDMPTQRSTKNLFAKMFRKKGAASPLSVTVPLPNEVITPQPSPFRISALSDEATVGQSDTLQQLDTWSSVPLSSPSVSHSVVLGVHPTHYPPVNNPRGRPIKYVWVVRKWLKGVDTSILNGVMGKLNVGARDPNGSSMPHIEVRFEWSREPKKRNRRKSRPKSSNSREGPLPSNTFPRGAFPRHSKTLRPDKHDHRNSLISHHSSGSDTAASSTNSAHRPIEGSDDESDPEDSETPWTCTVAAQSLEQPSQYHQNDPHGSCIRLKVATLAPTPHHPKVVGLLKMPFPLPDIEVERLEVRRRVVTPQGISKTTVHNTGEFVLTAEEIKDTVSSTALWLVVREAFGGVGRERKKGKS